MWTGYNARGMLLFTPVKAEKFDILGGKTPSANYPIMNVSHYSFWPYFSSVFGDKSCSLTSRQLCLKFAFPGAKLGFLFVGL